MRLFYVAIAAVTIAVVGLLVVAFTLGSDWPASDSAQANHGNGGSGAGTVDIVAVDTDPTNPDTVNGGAAGGNTASEVGDIDQCIEVESVDTGPFPGPIFVIDVVLDEIDPSDDIAGYGYNLKYDGTVINITAKVINFITPSAFEIIAEPLPDLDGNYRLDPAQFSGPFNSGEGVLTRFTLTAVGSGTSPLDLDDDIFGDGTPDIITSISATLAVNHVLDGLVAVDEPCPSPPTADPKVVAATEDTPAIVTMTGLDTDTCELTFDDPANVTGGGVGAVTSPGDNCTAGAPNTDSATVTFTPTDDSCGAGAGSFTYTVTDADAFSSNPATVTIDIACTPDAPSCPGGSATVDENSGTNAVNLPNCTDNDAGQTVSCALDTDATNGTATVSDCNTTTYEPDADFCGDDSYTYIGTDDDSPPLSSAPATVDITVTCINEAPDCPDATPVTVDEDSTDNPVALPGCTDPEDDSVTCSLDTDASNGAATVAADCTSATYTPDADFCGDDSFTYKGTDNGAPSPASDTGNADVTVTCVQDAPTCTAANETVNAGESVTFSLPCTDVDVDDIIACSIVTGPSKGTVEIKDCRVTYTADADADGEDTFTYKANDGTEDTTVLTATITISGSQATPTPTPTPAALGATALPSAGSSPPDGLGMISIFIGISALLLALGAGTVGVFRARAARR